jgi:hypothetical protein
MYKTFGKRDSLGCFGGGAGTSEESGQAREARSPKGQAYSGIDTLNTAH